MMQELPIRLPKGVLIFIQSARLLRPLGARVLKHVDRSTASAPTSLRHAVRAR